MSRQPGTDWIVEGAQAAIYTYGRETRVRLATVERLTKTQIVLDGDRRFRRDDLRQIGPRGAWDALVELRRPDDKDVIDALAGQRIRGLVRAVSRATSGEISTLATAESALASIEAEVRRARATLDQLAGAPQPDAVSTTETPKD